MRVTANDIQKWAKAELDKIAARSIYPHDSAMYTDIAGRAGLSFQTVRQFRLGSQPNLSTDTLDRLVAAIKDTKRTKAA